MLPQTGPGTSVGAHAIVWKETSNTYASALLAVSEPVLLLLWYGNLSRWSSVLLQKGRGQEMH